MSAFHQNLKLINHKAGVIALADYSPGTVVFEFKGDKFTRETLTGSSYILQIGENRFLGPSGDLDDYISHSCNPNCGLSIIGSRAFLNALYLIKAGTQITFDYSTSSNDTLDQWQMECKCGTFNCRHVISGYQYLEKDLKDKYEKMGIIPSYLIGK